MICMVALIVAALTVDFLIFYAAWPLPESEEGELYTPEDLLSRPRE